MSGYRKKVREGLGDVAGEWKEDGLMVARKAAFPVSNWLSPVDVCDADCACGHLAESGVLGAALRVCVGENAFAKWLLFVCDWRREVGGVVVGRCAE
jgi:hypothetical protein